MKGEFTGPKKKRKGKHQIFSYSTNHWPCFCWSMLLYILVIVVFCYVPEIWRIDIGYWTRNFVSLSHRWDDINYWEKPPYGTWTITKCNFWYLNFYKEPGGTWTIVPLAIIVPTVKYSVKCWRGKGKKVILFIFNLILIF